MKKILYVIIALLFCATFSYGTTTVCTVTEIDNSILPEGSNNTLVLECDNVDDFLEGDTVKVKVKSKNNGSIEGC